MSAKSKRTIKLTLTPRQIKDDPAILEAIVATCKISEIELKDQDSKESPEFEISSNRIADEQLETKASDAARKCLDNKAKAITASKKKSKTSAKKTASKNEPLPDIKLIVEEQKNLREHIIELAKNGYTLTVQAALDWLYDMASKGG